MLIDFESLDLQTSEAHVVFSRIRVLHQPLHLLPSITKVFRTGCGGDGTSVSSCTRLVALSERLASGILCGQCKVQSLDVEFPVVEESLHVPESYRTSYVRLEPRRLSDDGALGVMPYLFDALEGIHRSK